MRRLLAATVIAAMLAAGAFASAEPPEEEDVIRLGDDPEEQPAPPPGEPPEGDVIRLGADPKEQPPPPAPLPWQGWLRGTFSNELALDTEFQGDPEHVFRTSHRLLLAVEADITATLWAQVSGRITWWAWIQEDGDQRYELEPELRDTWLHWTPLDWLALTVGLQTWSWGASDVWSPLDVLNPRDFREAVSASLETPKIPVLGVTLQLVPLPELGLSIAWLPFFEENRLSVFGDDFGMFGPGTDPPPLPIAGSGLLRNVHPSLVDDLQPLLRATERPDESPEHSTIGVRLTTSVAGLDLAAVYVYGWERLPEVRFDPRLAALLAVAEGGPLSAEALAVLAELQSGQLAAEDLYRGRYRRQHVAGVEAVWGIWDLLLRAEVAFSPEQTLYTREFLPIRKATAQAAAGIEYAWETGLVVAAEVHVLHVLDLADDRRLFLQAQDQVDLALVAIARALEYDALELQLAARYGPTLGDWMVVPEVGWRVTETWRLGAGARLFGGPAASPGGLYDDNDEVYVTSRLDF